MTDNTQAVGTHGHGLAVPGVLSGPTPDGQQHPAASDFIRVSDAQRRYFGGRMSLRWWYRQIEHGRLPHYRAGGTVLLRPADVEAFVGEGFRAVRPPASPPPPAPPPPAARPSPRPKPRSGPPRDGLRFFGD